ncbi:MAG: hypothetical protein M1828_006876 [Chrysothrix sp. TS-e1954]|nr:MAG: hypothetical protein M1828_006876 [Chrysothrix sp. TS-e1954]
MSNAVGDFPVKGKIALVTGGGSGINFAFSRLAVENGARIVIVDLKLTAEAEEFVSKHSSSAVFAKTDVTNWQQLKSAITTSLTQFGDVPDVYIAGAGIFDPAGFNYWDDAEEERYKEIDINVGHVIKLSRMAMRALVSRGKKGVVCSVASEAGLSGVYTVPLYCATKHAVVGFTKSMTPADQLEGVKIVTVCPGLVDSPLFDEERRASLVTLLPNAMKPIDVAAVMLMLVEEGRFLGGTVYELPSKEEGRVVPPWGAEPSKTAIGMMKLQQAEEHDNAPLFQKMRERVSKERISPWP